MNRRTEIRIETREQVTATILGKPDVSVPCHIMNFSRSGMCITVHEEIPSGKAVKVEWDNHFLLGRVRRVAPEGKAYRVGLELLYCSQWNGSMAAMLA